MPLNRFARFSALAPLALTLSCSSEKLGSPPTANGATVAAGQTAEAVIAAAGGSVVLATSEGANFTLQLPAAAVPSGTTISVTTATVAAQQRFHLRFAPAGLVLAGGAEATLTIQLPAAMALPAAGGIVYDGAPVEFERLVDGRIRLRLTAFAAAAPSSGVRVASLEASVESATESALCGGAPATANFFAGALIGGDDISTAAYGACMRGAVQRFAATGFHAAAVRAAVATAAYFMQIGSTGGAADAFLTDASTIACNAQRAAIDLAIASPVTTSGTLHTVVRPLLFWEQIIQQLAAQCSNVGLVEYRDVVLAKTDEAVAYYRQLKTAGLLRDASTHSVASLNAQVIDVGSPEYAAAIAEARAARETVHQVQSIPAGESVKAFTESQVNETLQPELLDAIIEAPWRACRNTGSYADLIELMELMESPARVKQAAQYCGTMLETESRTSVGASIAILNPALGGVSATERRVSGTLEVSRSGTIRLSGPIRKLSCPVGVSVGSEELQLRLNNTPIQNLASGPYLNDVLVIDVATALVTAGIDPDDFTSGTLGIVRIGSPCGGFWGAAPEPLLSVTLSTGGCVPAEGEFVCVTLIEAPVAAADYRLLEMNARGQVLLERRYAYGRCSVADEAVPAPEPCAAVWKAGSIINLPHWFRAVDIADDGSVGGNQVLERNGGAYVNPSVVLADHTTTVTIAQSQLFTYEFPARGPFGRYAAMLTYSRAGRATYSTTTQGGSSDDLGFCDFVPQSADWQCFRVQYFSSVSPNWNSVLRHSAVRPAPYVTFDVLHDADGAGVFGGALAQPGASRSGMIDWSTAGGSSVLGIVAASGDGYQLRVARDFSLSIVPSPSGLDGFVPAALGPEGHVVACGGSAQARIVKASDGTLLATLPQTFTHVVGAQSHVLRVPCALGGRRWIDDRGRILVGAQSSTTGRTVGAILTPPGVSLP